MKFFIDTADLDEIAEAVSMGLVDGVTTNPSLMMKVGAKDFDGHMEKICEMVSGPVSAEVVATDFEGMMKEARHNASIHENIVVKIPFIPEGVKALKACHDEKIKTNCTLVFQPLQALIAAKAGATFMSPFVGRLDDVGSFGMQIIEQIRTIYDNYDYKTEILVASVRNPTHVLEAALMGADVATMPFGVIKNLMNHPLTDIGLDKFLKDWKKLQGN